MRKRISHIWRPSGGPRIRESILPLRVLPSLEMPGPLRPATPRQWPALLIFAALPWTALTAQAPAPDARRTSTVIEAAANQEKIPVEVEWSAAVGASRYRIEIRDAAQKVVLSAETKENRYRAELPPGNYQKRVGLVNRFSRTYLWSDWSPLQIIRVLQPAIQAPTTVQALPPGSGQKTVTVKTAGVMPQTVYRVVDQQGKDPGAAVSVQQKGDEAIVTVDTNQLPPGKYDLIMENPGSQSAVQRGLISIGPTTGPGTGPTGPTRRGDPARGRDWSKLTPMHIVPGIAQRRRGEVAKGNGLLIAFFSSVAVSAYSYQKATIIYRRLGSDPLYAVFKDNTTASVYGPGVAANDNLYYASLYKYASWTADSAAYNRYRAYSYAGAFLAAGLFAYHASDVYRFEIGPSRAASGEPGLGAALTLSF